MFSRRFVVVTAAAVAVGFSSSAHAAPCVSADVLPGSAPGQARSATLCLLNAERTARGLGKLRPHRRLAIAAARHTRDMVRRQYFAHDSLNGRSFDDRIQATGYFNSANGWTAGENLAWGSASQSTPRLIVAAWMASHGHRDNILNPRFTQIGIAILAGAPVPGVAGDAATYTAEFGNRG